MASLTKAAVTIRTARSIFVLLLAVAIATLPVTLGFAAVASTKMAVMAVTQAMPDCDQQHHGASSETQKTADHGRRLAACAATCICFTDTDVSGIAYSAPESAALKPVRARISVSSLIGSPPFRPPRA